MYPRLQQCRGRQGRPFSHYTVGNFIYLFVGKTSNFEIFFCETKRNFEALFFYHEKSCCFCFSCNETKFHEIKTKFRQKNISRTVINPMLYSQPWCKVYMAGFTNHYPGAKRPALCTKIIISIIIF